MTGQVSRDTAYRLFAQRPSPRCARETTWLRYPPSTLAIVTKYYTFVASSTPTTTDWVPAYSAEVPALVARHGGRYLALTAEIDRLQGEGEVPWVISIVEWPSKEAAEAFFADPGYLPHLDARLAGTSGVAYLLPATDEDNNSLL